MVSKRLMQTFISHRSKGSTGQFGCAVAPVQLHAQYRAMVLDPKAWADEVDWTVENSSHIAGGSQPFIADSRRAWQRLIVAVLIGSLGSVGMWSVVVVLPEVQSAFGAARGTASLAFTFGMLGFGS